MKKSSKLEKLKTTLQLISEEAANLQAAMHHVSESAYIELRDRYSVACERMTVYEDMIEELELQRN